MHIHVNISSHNGLGTKKNCSGLPHRLVRVLSTLYNIVKYGIHKFTKFLNSLEQVNLKVNFVRFYGTPVKLFY